MSEVSFARKYRPSSIKDYIGVENKNKIINRYKDVKNIPQTVLVSGPPGTGKTTILRLIAQQLQCADPQEGCACGKCLSCLTIEDELIHAEFGTKTLGITELDAGTDGGKDAVVALQEDVLQPPTYGYKYNIFIIDECHMLTSQAQNALLKVLEELPKTSIIMLATTNPDKLLQTVRDRCGLRIQTKPAPVEELLARLKYVCLNEKIKTSDNALQLIIKSCKRNPRESLTVLENVCKNYDHDVTVKNVLKELNRVGIEMYDKYISGAQSNDPIMKALEICEELETEGISYKSFMDGLIEFVTTCVKIKYGIGLESVTQEMLLAARRLFNTYSISDLDCLLQIMEYAAKMMYTSESTEKLVLITTAMRISKVKILEAGLQFVEKDTVTETERGSALAVKALKEDRGVEAAPLEVSENTLATVFGKQVKEIASGNSLRIDAENKTEEQALKDENTADSLSDDDLLAMFSN